MTEEIFRKYNWNSQVTAYAPYLKQCKNFLLICGNISNIVLLKTFELFCLIPELLNKNNLADLAVLLF